MAPGTIKKPWVLALRQQRKNNSAQSHAPTSTVLHAHKPTIKCIHTSRMFERLGRRLRVWRMDGVPARRRSESLRTRGTSVRGASAARCTLPWGERDGRRNFGSQGKRVREDCAFAAGASGELARRADLGLRRRLLERLTLNVSEWPASEVTAAHAHVKSELQPAFSTQTTKIARRTEGRRASRHAGPCQPDRPDAPRVPRAWATGQRARPRSPVREREAVRNEVNVRRRDSETQVRLQRRGTYGSVPYMHGTHRLTCMTTSPTCRPAGCGPRTDTTTWRRTP
jgi:hypothetical protein